MLVVLGVQVYYILKEVRRTIEKTNKVLDDTGTITESISKPVASFSSVTMGLKASSLLTVAKVVKNLISHDDDSKEKRG